MFRPGEYIIYGGEGVCEVKAVGQPPFGGGDRQYYTLAPVYHTGVIYAPVDVSIPMRPILTRQEALALIDAIPGMEEDFAFRPDPRKAAQEYKAVLQTYDCANLLRLIRMLYNKNRQAITDGKHYGQTDDRFLRQAKELLYGELAMALDIPFGEVEAAIVRAVEGE